MIKKYIEFIKENLEVKSENSFNSLGEWVEYLYDFYKNDEIKLSNFSLSKILILLIQLLSQ